MSEQTWFITGASRGLGRAITEAALAAGDRVIATARRPSHLKDLVDAYGERIVPVELDVTDADAVRTAVDRRIDVVVNNAGYANLGPIETTSEEDFRRQFETNFWGVYNVTRAALPGMRERGSGTIVQISSIGGRVGGSAGLGSYQAAKFAVDGLSRVLAVETAPLGLRVLVVEPGGFATDWAGSSMTIHEVPAAYDATVGVLARGMGAANFSAGDPKRAGEIIVRVVHGDDVPTHLPLGGNATTMAQAEARRELAEAQKWEQVSRSADFPQAEGQASSSF
ncbi:SDR family NAD(P)-dependent oxidoreductase [Actinoplanes sp. CA-142083]|uniref:SDR family NAD(P)-dependent oxidoreductase n=1 Tax=Actinoplanes sp. CA-142083 TaxID=3239903 RepID=UPI003D8C18B6